METDQDPDQPDVTVDYSCDRKTGRINLTIQYDSPAGTWPKDHERRHFDLVKKIVDDSGILGPCGGEMCVRIRRADVESVYYVNQVGEKLVWRLDSQRQIGDPLPSSPPGPLPTDPIRNPADPA